MKIIIINRAMGVLFGGGESFDYSAAIYLKKRGHEVKVITGKSPNSITNDNFDSIDIEYIVMPFIRQAAYSVERVSKKLAALFYHLDNLIFEILVYRLLESRINDFDLVQCCSLFRLPQWLTKNNIPVVSWLPGPPSRWARNKLLKLLKRRNFGLFTHGEPVTVLCGMGLVEGRDFSVIEPGVELSIINSIKSNKELKEDLGIDKDALLGVTSARLVPIKNIGYLLQGISYAKRSGVIWNWVVLGDGPMRPYLNELLENLDIDKQVFFLGHQDRGDVYKWLSNSDVFALVSKFENFSIATLEAMAFKLPIIGTDVGYLKHLVKNSNAGIVVPLDRPDILASSLIELAESKPLRNEYGVNGRSYVESLDWLRISEKLEVKYESLVGKNKILRTN